MFKVKQWLTFCVKLTDSCVLEYVENFVIVSYILGMLAHLLSDMLKCTVVNCLKSYLFSLFPGPVLKKHQITCQMFLRTIKGIYNGV